MGLVDYSHLSQAELYVDDAIAELKKLNNISRDVETAMSLLYQARPRIENAAKEAQEQRE